MSDVSRETPPVPTEARGVFAEGRLALAEQYVDLLASAGVERGLIGPREAPRLWDRHVLNCAAVAAAVPDGSSVADLGSGAGLPGVVIALMRPTARVELVEPLLRRATFLEEAVAVLGLSDRVRVTRARAEELHGDRRFDVVTARALAPLDRLLGWAMPLVAPGGELVAMKGRSVQDEVAAALPTVRRLRCAPPRVETLTAPGGSSTATVVRVAHADPRRVG